MTYSYQWQRCNSTGASCSLVAGATTASYVLASADVGSTMRTSVTASNAAGSVTASTPATAVVSTSPSLPAGTLMYQKQWEDGQVLSGSWGAQAANFGTPDSTIHRGTINPDSTTADRGSISGKIVLPAYTGGARAAEMLHSRVSGNHLHDYYALAWKTADFNWGHDMPTSFAQFNYANINGSPGALSAQGYTGSGGTNSQGTASLHYLLAAGGPTQTGQPTPYFSGTPVGGGFGAHGTGLPGPTPWYIRPPGSIQANTWYEFIIHVYWTTDLDGIVEAWWRIKGNSAWNAAFSHGPWDGAFPTLQWGQNESGYTITPSNIAALGTTDKFGMYSGPSASSTVWHDNYCRATSFNAAASCFG
jgi:hypothetical protein